MSYIAPVLLWLLVYVQRGFGGGSEGVQRGLGGPRLTEPPLNPQYTPIKPSSNTGHKANNIRPKGKLFNRKGI